MFNKKDYSIIYDELINNTQKCKFGLFNKDKYICRLKKNKIGTKLNTKVAINPVAYTIVLIIILLVIPLEIVYAANSSATTFTISGKIFTPQVYAKIDFSTGDFSQINQFGAVTDHPPIATCQIITTITKASNYSMLCTQTDPAADPGTSNRAKAVLSQIGNLHLTEMYYGFSVYLSPTLKAERWVQIFEENQYDPRILDWQHIAQLQVVNQNGQPRLSVLKGEIAPDDSLWMDSNPIPLGEWIDFVAYVKLAEDGEVMVWQNGNLLADVHYATAIPGLEPRAYPAFGLYQSHNNPPGNWLIIGRFVAANTFELANS